MKSSSCWEKHCYLGSYRNSGYHDDEAATRSGTFHLLARQMVVELVYRMLLDVLVDSSIASASKVYTEMERRSKNQMSKRKKKRKWNHSLENGTIFLTISLYFMWFNLHTRLFSTYCSNTYFMLEFILKIIWKTIRTQQFNGFDSFHFGAEYHKQFK